MLEGMNYLHAKYQINIFRNKKVIKLLELWTLWKKEKKRRENSEYNRVVITTLKICGRTYLQERFLSIHVFNKFYVTLLWHVNLYRREASFTDFFVHLISAILHYPSVCQPITFYVSYNVSV